MSRPGRLDAAPIFAIMPNMLVSPREVATVFGVSIDTVRGWEIKGILPRAHKTLGGHRRWEAAEVAPVAVARGTSVAGHPLFWAVAADRLYVFYNEAARAEFAVDPGRTIATAERKWPEVAQAIGQ